MCTEAKTPGHCSVRQGQGAPADTVDRVTVAAATSELPDRLEAHVPDDDSSGIVTCAANHRPAGVAPRRAAVQPFDGRTVRKALVKAKRIVDVVDVASVYPEVLLDAWRRQRKRIGNQAGSAWRKGVHDAQQVLDVLVLFSFPRRVLRHRFV